MLLIEKVKTQLQLNLKLAFLNNKMHKGNLSILKISCQESNIPKKNVYLHKILFFEKIFLKIKLFLHIM